MPADAPPAPSPAAPPLPAAAAPRRATDRVADAAHRHRRWLYALLVLLYAAGFTGQWRPGADSAVHLQVAQSLHDDEGFTHPVGAERNLAPGLATVTAVASTLFSDEGVVVWPALLLQTLAAGLTLLAFHRLVRRWEGRAAATLLTLMLGVSFSLYRYQLELLTDVPFLLWATAGLLAAEALDARRAKRALWGAVGLVCAVVWMAAFRSVALVWVAGFAGYALTRALGTARHRKRYAAAVLGIVGAAVVVRWVLPTALGLPGSADEAHAARRLTEFLGPTLHRAATRNVPELLTESLSEAALGVDLGPAASAVVAGLLLAGVARLAARRPLWVCVFVAFAVQWSLLVVEQRYVLAVLPILLAGWWSAARWVEGRDAARWAGWRGWVAAVMIGLWVLPNAGRAVSRVVEQRTAELATTADTEAYRSLRGLVPALRHRVGRHDALIADEGYVLTVWLDGTPAYTPAELRTTGRARRQTIRRLASHTWLAPDAEPGDARRLWLVGPPSDLLQRKLDDLGLEAGPAIYTEAGAALHALGWTDSRRVERIVSE